MLRQHTLDRRGRSRGFTLVEVAAVIGVASFGVAIFGVMSAQPDTGKPAPNTPPAASPGSPLDELAKARDTARQLKCSTHVRAHAQSMIVWANNNSSYPMPSLLDTRNETVAAKGRAKDTTANLISVLIFNASISPEIAVCPSESNPKVKINKNYEYSAPSKGVVPKRALWDPAFSADFTGEEGHVSYAHLQPSGQIANAETKTEASGRLTRWTDTFNADEAIVGDRGPEIQSVAADKPDDVSTYKANTKAAKSNTFGRHGQSPGWAGNIAFNDGHVEFLTSLVLKSVGSRYTTPDKSSRFDTLFFDEPDDASQRNAFLGIFTSAGAKPADFKSIWD